MTLKYIPLDSDIKLGDIFVTSGIGNSYPTGYSVGRVSSIDEEQEPSFMTILLEPMQNMNNAANAIGFSLVISSPRNNKSY